MIVREIMTTKMITVTADDTLSHAANLLRQFQIHHLPVVRHIHAPETEKIEEDIPQTLLILEGLLTSLDIDLVVALDTQRSSADLLHRPWYRYRVADVMPRAPIRLPPPPSAAT